MSAPEPMPTSAPAPALALAPVSPLEEPIPSAPLAAVEEERPLAESAERAAGAATALTHPEYLEELMCKIEHAAELRAEAEAVADRSRRASATPSGGSRPGTSDGVRRRRGGSVSVSRFGAPIDANGEPGPGTPSRLSALVLQNPVYQHAALAAAAAGSHETIASSLDAAVDGPAPEDEHTVTQVQRIPGRSRSATLTKAVGAALGRRLSRATSRDVLADVPVVVGVVVRSELSAAPAPDAPAADTEMASPVSPTTPPTPQVTTTIVADAAVVPERPKLKRDRSRLSAWADKLVSKLRRRSSENMRVAAVGA